MLTDAGYHTALAIYLISALLLMVFGNLWILRGRSVGLRLLVTLPLAALFLTPAFTAPGGEILAPALVVAVFAGIDGGLIGAEHALQPLSLLVGLGLGLGLVAFVLLGLQARRRRLACPESSR